MYQGFSFIYTLMRNIIPFILFEKFSLPTKEEITQQIKSEFNSLEDAKFEDKYEDNDQIEKEADLIVDFSENNPFGNY